MLPVPTAPWRPRPCFADSVALLAAGGLTVAVATPVGVELGVVTPPSNMDALDLVAASLPVVQVPDAPEAGSWVQFVPSLPPPAEELTVQEPTPEPIQAKGSRKRLRTIERTVRPPRSTPNRTGSSVMSEPFGLSRLSIHRADKRTHPRYRASLHALQRLTRRPTVVLPAGPRSAATDPIARIPLQPGRESWQASRDLVLNGHLPHPDLVRTESFVAVASNHSAVHAGSEAVGIHTDIAADDADARTIVVQVTATTPPPVRQDRAPLDLVLVVDTSGSMGVSGGLDEVRAAVLQLVQQLGPDDRVSVVAFHGDPTVLLPPVNSVDADVLAARLAELQPEGATDAASGVRFALGQLKRRATDRHHRHIVMFSDGDLMATGREAWVDAASEVRDARATLTTFAIGQEWAESGALEAQMARLGARHHAVRDGDEAVAGLQHVLGASMQPPAESVTLAVRFDPRVVDTYELLGWQGGGPGRLAADVPQVDLPAGSHSSALLRVRLHTASDARAGQSLGQVLVSRGGQAGHTEAPLVVPDVGVPPLDARPDLAMADAAADLADALRQADADALDEAARAIHARARPGRPEDAVLLRVARRSANLARLPVLAPGTDDRLDPRLNDLMLTLGDDCFTDLSTRRGARHGQITARARFHHGRFAGAVILDDKIDDRMLEACIIQRLRTWEPPAGLEGDLVLPLVWGPTTAEGELSSNEG